MNICTNWKAYKNKEEFTGKYKAYTVLFSAVRTDELITAVKETFDSNEGQSYAKIAADMRGHRWKICWTVKKDIGYSSYRKSHCMLIQKA